MFADAIRNTSSENEIYFLLTAYVEAVRYADKLNGLPAPLRRLPVADSTDTAKRYEELAVELNRSSRAQNEPVGVVIKEALLVFGAAIERLDALPARHARVPTAAERVHPPSFVL
jgi:hypothetical protein